MPELVVGSDSRPPCPPRPSDLSDLGFVRRPMVRWLDPHQLLDTAARVLLSGLFSSYADNGSYLWATNCLGFTATRGTRPCTTRTSSISSVCTSGPAAT